jgi:hypothetical protein
MMCKSRRNTCGCGCGELTRYKYKHGHRPIAGYREAGGARVHRARAEKALGRALPENVPVHHADGSKNASAPLVICQDAAYHNLLHARMKVVRAGGDPDTHKFCPRCRAVKPLADFGVSSRALRGLQSYCRVCVNATQRAYRQMAATV